MTPRFRSKALLLAGFALTAACDDPVDPCAAIGCGVDGVDLAVITAEVEWSRDQPVDERVGGRLVQPGDDMVWRYRIINRGDEASLPVAIHVGTFFGLDSFSMVDERYLRRIEVPALEPGETFGDRVTVEAPPSGRLRTDEFTGGVYIAGFMEDPFIDGDYLNNRSERHYHLAVPYLTVVFNAAEDTARVGEEVMVWVGLQNESPITALRGDYAMAFCSASWDPFLGAYCSSTPFGLRDVVDLEPGEVSGSWIPLTIPASAVPLEQTGFGMSACVGHGTADMPAEESRAVLNGQCASQPVMVLQNLDVACSPPTIVLPDTLDASDADSECEHRFQMHHVWAFEVDEPGLHSLTALAGDLEHATIFGRDHTQIPMNHSNGEFYLPAAGRYHMLVVPLTADPIYAIE